MIGMVVGAIGWSVVMLISGGIAGMGGDPTPFPPFGGWLTVGMVQRAALHFVFGNIPLGVGVVVFIALRDRMG